MIKDATKSTLALNDIEGISEENIIRNEIIQSFNIIWGEGGKSPYVSVDGMNILAMESPCDYQMIKVRRFVCRQLGKTTGRAKIATVPFCG